MSKVNVKVNKKSQKTPTLKIVGIVFMLVTLLAALALTNNTVRQFITSSFAFDWECAQKGSPSARRNCQAEADWRKSSVAAEQARLYTLARDCANNPGSCTSLQVTDPSNPWRWYRQNVNNYKCTNSINGCRRNADGTIYQYP